MNIRPRYNKLTEKNKPLYNIFAIIITIAIFIWYQQNTFAIKIDFFSQLLLIVIVALVLLPLVNELNILNVLKIKKDIENLKNETIEKFALLQSTIISTVNQQQNVQVINHSFGEKEAQELTTYLKEKTRDVSQDIKEKAKNIAKNDTELSQPLLKFLINYKKIQENLDILSGVSENEILKNRSISNQARNLYKNNIIDKKLYLAIQYFIQKRGEVFHGRELSKSNIEEGIGISENILILLEELIYDKYIGMYVIDRQDQ
ncbi:MAG: hypothetical protein WCX10_03835 [Bacteroidales bacterium]